MTIFAIFAALSIAGIILYLLQVVAAYSLLRKKPKPEERTTMQEIYCSPPVSILKPLKGLDDNLFDNLSSFCLQDYPEYEILFCLQDFNDPAYKVAKKVQDKYPDTIIARPEEILTYKCDILSPCALGPVFTRKNIDQLHCRIIAGGAYNVLENSSLAEELFKKGILYAPDFVINSGELFLTADALKILSREEALASARKIYDIMAKILAISKREKVSPYQAAYKLAKERIKKVGDIKNILCCI